VSCFGSVGNLVRRTEFAKTELKTAVGKIVEFADETVVDSLHDSQARLVQVDTMNAVYRTYIHSSGEVDPRKFEQPKDDSVPIEYSEDSCQDDFPRLQSLISNEDSFIQSFVSKI